jgi:hypothetical protein
MLRIGYVRLRDAQSAQDPAILDAMGCHVVRAEEHASELTTLSSILDFIGPGDQLVITRLQHIAPSSRGALEVLTRLEDHGASLHIVEPDLCSHGKAAGRCAPRCRPSPPSSLRPCPAASPPRLRRSTPFSGPASAR